MSHTTKIKSVAIRDESAIEQAVTKLQNAGVNCSLKTNTMPRMYYSSQKEQCEYVLSLPGCRFDVGFQKQADGTFSPVYDEFANAVGSQIGAVCKLPVAGEDQALVQLGKFLQAYTECATVNAAVQAGFMVESTTTDKDGNVVLELASYN